jgi:hypothetical protein
MGKVNHNHVEAKGNLGREIMSYLPLLVRISPFTL